MAVAPQDQVAAATEDRSTTAAVTSEKWLLALTSLGALMVTLDALVVASAFATIRRELHASIDQLQWTANAYTLSVAMMLMVASVLGDRGGRRRMFVTGLSVFTVASAVCAVAPTIGALIAARAVQGTGAAFIMPMAMGLLVAGFPPERRGWATGIFAGITGLGVFAGPIVGGAVTQGVAWQGIFWINVPIGLVVMALTVLKVAESRGTRRPLDVIGTLLITSAVVGIVWGVVRGGTVGWAGTEAVTTLAAGGLLLVAFIGWETKAEHPMLPLRLFANPSFSAGNAAGFLLTASMFATVFFAAQYMHAAYGSGALESGLQLLPWTGSLFVVGPIAGCLIDRVGERPFAAIGLSVQAVGMFWMSHEATGHGYAGMVLPMIVAGFGVSLALPAAQAAVTGAVPPQAAGMAGGIYSMMRQTGGAVGVAVLTAVFTGAGGFADFPRSMQRVLEVSAGLSLAAGIAAIFIAPRRTNRPDKTRVTSVAQKQHEEKR
ncbi:EmrB/QacA subfamily drug resistance transporter [Nocardia sp. GAS34]|uniref:MFS transporter n=1 Tax=unclassified Nocardia TaxID=2637762 RepID=UPI003D1DA874